VRAVTPLKETDDGDDPPTEKPALDLSEEALLRLAETIPTDRFVKFVAAVIRRQSSGTPIEPEIRWQVEGCSREQTIPIPMACAAADLSPLAKKLLAVLVDAEGWLTGPEIAFRLDPDGGRVERTSGSFNRATADLLKADLIESQPRKGFRAKPR
jgi:hypothetical protein